MILGKVPVPVLGLVVDQAAEAPVVEPEDRCGYSVVQEEEVQVAVPEVQVVQVRKNGQQESVGRLNPW